LSLASALVLRFRNEDATWMRRYNAVQSALDYVAELFCCPQLTVR